VGVEDEARMLAPADAAEHVEARGRRAGRLDDVRGHLEHLDREPQLPQPALEKPRDLAVGARRVHARDPDELLQEGDELVGRGVDLEQDAPFELARGGHERADSSPSGRPSCPPR
jgi:hypothetical protein